MENNKKILIPTIVAVATLILLVFGATYAYFTIESTNNFGTKELNATVEDMADAVVLEQVESTLSLDVTRAMMSEDNVGTTYYASGSSTPASIAKISVAGEGKYACNYTMTITKSSSSLENDLYTASYGDVRLTINNQIFDFDSSTISFPKTYKGKINDLTKESPQYITTNLSIVNQEWEQNDLKGKDVTLTYSISDFDCESAEQSEYTDLAFTYEYMDDIGYEEDSVSSDYYGTTLVIPEVFRGDDGVWYRVTSIGNLHGIYFEGIELPDSITSLSGLTLNDFSIIKLPKKLVSISEKDMFGSCKDLYIPKSLKNVEPDILKSALDLENIYYEGTEEEWYHLFASIENDDYGVIEDMNMIISYLGVSKVPTMHYNVEY